MRHFLGCALPMAGLFAVALGGGSALPHDVDVDNADISACEIDAFSVDPDPKGLNVRSGPGTGNPVIARLPPRVEVQGSTFGVAVSITGSKNGWFRIDRAETDIPDRDVEVVFEGEGWVSGRFLGLWVEEQYLRGGPSDDAAIVADLYASDDSNAYFDLDRLHACHGSWVEVEGTYDGKHLRGWSNWPCPSQVTTCP